MHPTTIPAIAPGANGDPPGAVGADVVVGERVVGEAEVGDLVVGEVVVGEAVVGDAVVGDAEVGEAVVGKAVGEGVGVSAGNWNAIALPIEYWAFPVEFVLP